MKNKVLRDGDTLFIKELDRLGRNAEKIKEEWKEILSKGISLVVMDMPILDTRKYRDGMEKVISNIVLELLSYIAQQEREKMKKRQAEVIAAARLKEKDLGRPKINMPANYGEYYSKCYKSRDITPIQAMKELGIKKTKFYEFKKETKQI